MRLSVALLLIALAGVVGGAWLIGRWAVGIAVIADSVAVGAWALLHDDGQPEPQAAQIPIPGTPGLQQVLERFRDAS